MERLSEALAVPRTCTRQGCRSPHVLMGGWVEHPGLAGGGQAEVEEGAQRAGVALCREPLQGASFSLPLKCGRSCSWAQASGMPPGTRGSCVGPPGCRCCQHTHQVSATDPGPPGCRTSPSQGQALLLLRPVPAWPTSMQILSTKNTCGTVNVFSLPSGFLNNIFFSLAYFIVRIQYMIHMTYTICVTVYVTDKAFGQE